MSLAAFVLAFARRHWHAYASAALMLVGIAVMTVWIPRRVGHIIDGLVAGDLAGAAMWREIAILLAMGAAIYLLRVGWRMQLFSAAFRLGVELRTELFERLSQQTPQYFHRERTGDLMARATNDVDAVEMAAGEAFLAGFDGTLTLVLVVAMMTLGVDWRLGLVCLLPFPFMAYAFFVVSRHVHDAWRASLDRFSDLNDQVQESMAAVRTLRALGLESRAGQDFARRVDAAARVSLDAQRWEYAYEPAVGLTLAAAATLALGVGGYLVWHGESRSARLPHSRCTSGSSPGPCSRQAGCWPSSSVAWPAGRACSRCYARRSPSRTRERSRPCPPARCASTA